MVGGCGRVESVVGAVGGGRGRECGRVGSGCGRGRECGRGGSGW